MPDAEKSIGGESELISRRDFMDGVLLGAGSALLSMAAPGLARAAPAAQRAAYQVLRADWTGPGGVGDYAGANGNTHVTVNAAHALREGRFDPKDLPSPTESYDLVVVGGGIAGLCSCYEYVKVRKTAKVLILDNNAIFGGEAKRNEIEVEGYRLHAPQGSNMCVWPPKVAEKLDFFWHKAWRELGLPMGDESDAPVWVDYPKMVAPKNNYSAMMVVRDRWPQAHFYKDPKDSGRWKVAMDPWKSGYRDLPWPEEAKQQLAHVDAFVLQAPAGVKDIEAWMDSMTYKDYLKEVVGVTHLEVFKYLDPQIAAYGTGMGCDTVSALAARNFRAPATLTAEEIERANKRREVSDLQWEPVAFPGGNTVIGRHFVKRLIPNAIAGGDSLKEILYGNVNWRALDLSEQPVRIRVNSTAIDVSHEGSPGSSTSVLVGYINNVTGTTSRVRAKAVIMASGQWVNKYIVRDAPASVLSAMGEFDHAPMLIINVAVKHWRFLEKLGAPAVRWFDGVGWFTNLLAQMSINGQHAPVDPNKPTVLSFYVPYTTFTPGIEGLPLHAQCVLARTALYGLSYRDIEGRIRQQLAQSLGPYGFDDKRDIAAVITNRWGHAYVTPGPGFYRGTDGKTSPREIVKAGYGRVRFGHSELSGEQLWPYACGEGERAARQVLQFA